MQRNDWRDFVFVFGVLVGVGLASGTAGWAQSVGDRVLVTQNFETKIRNEKVDQVYLGQIGTMAAVQDKWCSLEGVRGWVPLQYVMSLESGLKFYTQRLAARPQDTEALTTRGLILFELGRLDDAFRDFNSALKVNDKMYVPWNNRGMVCMAQGKWNDALRDVDYAIKLNPKYADAYANRGLIYANLGRFPEAVADLQQAVALEPTKPLHHARLGSVLFEQGDGTAAKAAFEAAAKLNPRISEIYVGLGNIQLSQGEHELALKNAERAIELDARNAKAWNLAGWLKFQLGDSPGAIRCYNKAVNLEPTLGIAYSNRGVALVEQGRLDEAIKDYDRALKHDPKAALTYSNRGTAWMDRGDFTKARASFETSLELAPELPEALNVYAWFLATCPDESFRDGARAVQLAERAVAGSQRQNWYHLDTLAAAKAAVGEFDAAIQDQTSALEKCPPRRKEACQERLELYRNGQPVRGAGGKSAGG